MGRTSTGKAKSANKQKKAPRFVSELKAGKLNGQKLRGGNQSGKYTTPAGVRGKRAREPGEAELHHFSHVAQVATAGCTEVQTMRVNNRIVVATNNLQYTMEIERNLRRIQQENQGAANLAKDTMLNFARPAVTANPNERALLRHASKLVERAGSGTFPLLQSALSGPACIHASTFEALGPYLRDDAYKDCLIFITGADSDAIRKAHAEQKLAYALWHHNIGTQAMIIGCKRPCCVCHVTLKFFKDKLGVSINQPGLPGMKWQNPAGFFWYVAEEAIKQRKVTEADVDEFVGQEMRAYKSHVTGANVCETDNPLRGEFTTAIMSESESDAEDESIFDDDFDMTQ